MDLDIVKKKIISRQVINNFVKYIQNKQYIDYNKKNCI